MPVGLLAILALILNSLMEPNVQLEGLIFWEFWGNQRSHPQS